MNIYGSGRNVCIKGGRTAVIFGKYINRYYLKHAPVLLLGILSLLTVDYIQLLIPELYRLVINGVNLGQVVVDGQTMPSPKKCCSNTSACP